MTDLFFAFGIICLSISVVILTIRVRTLQKIFDKFFGTTYFTDDGELK